MTERCHFNKPCLVKVVSKFKSLKLQNMNKFMI